MPHQLFDHERTRPGGRSPNRPRSADRGREVRKFRVHASLGTPARAGDLCRHHVPTISFTMGSIFAQIAEHVTRPKYPPAPDVTTSFNPCVRGSQTARSFTS